MTPQFIEATLCGGGCHNSRQSCVPTRSKVSDIDNDNDNGDGGIGDGDTGEGDDALIHYKVGIMMTMIISLAALIFILRHL